MLFAFFRGDQMRGWWRTEFVAIGVREWDRKWGSLVCGVRPWKFFLFVCVLAESRAGNRVDPQILSGWRIFFLNEWRNCLYLNWMKFYFTKYSTYTSHMLVIKKNLEHMLVIEIESDQPPCILLIWIGDQQKTTIAPAPIKNRPLLLFHRNVEHMFETEQPPPNLGWCLHINFFKSPGLVQSTNKTVIVRTTIITPTKNCIYILILLQNLYRVYFVPFMAFLYSDRQ